MPGRKGVWIRAPQSAPTPGSSSAQRPGAMEAHRSASHRETWQLGPKSQCFREREKEENPTAPIQLKSSHTSTTSSSSREEVGTLTTEPLWGYFLFMLTVCWAAALFRGRCRRDGCRRWAQTMSLRARVATRGPQRLQHRVCAPQHVLRLSAQPHGSLRGTL